MQSNFYDTSSFIDFGASPMPYAKDDLFGEDIFSKLHESEWAFLETDLSSTSTEINGGIFNKDFAEKKTQSGKSNSVKFCERLANEILSQLDNSRFSDRLILCFNDLLKPIMNLANCDITNLKFFNLYPLNALIALWKERLALFSKSNGLEEKDWVSIFSLEELPAQLESITNNYAEVGSFIRFNDLAGKEIFLTSYKKLLMTCNVILVNEVIFRVIAPDQRFREEISNIEDLILMVHEYWLFKHYNHSSHKFALECCRSCKVCMSSALPFDFADKLKCSRVRFERLIQVYDQLGVFRAQELNTDLITKLFTFWTQILWI